LLWDWIHGKSYKDLGLHPMALNKLVRKYISTMLRVGISNKKSQLNRAKKEG